MGHGGMEERTEGRKEGEDGGKRLQWAHKWTGYCSCEASVSVPFRLFKIPPLLFIPPSLLRSHLLLLPFLLSYPSPISLLTSPSLTATSSIPLLHLSLTSGPFTHLPSSPSQRRPTVQSSSLTIPSRAHIFSLRSSLSYSSASFSSNFFLPSLKLYTLLLFLFLLLLLLLLLLAVVLFQHPPP